MGGLEGLQPSKKTFSTLRDGEAVAESGKEEVLRRLRLPKPLRCVNSVMLNSKL
jgi:hypothetical protein